MRIALLYPPPWKIAAPGEPPYPDGEGPPRNLSPTALDAADFNQAPYGMLSIAAQALAAGYEVQTLNLSTFAWSEVQRRTRSLCAELYGLSCHTANRRGVALMAALLRKRHPTSHIVVGGPHVSALPRETLEHHRAIDTVVIGEGEASFMELARRLDAGKPAAGIAGTAWRSGGRVEIGPPRPPLEDLDALVSPVDYFPLRTLVTSRGCPGRCTFCASRLMWGRRLRFHSADFVATMIDRAVNRWGLRSLAFKDDTFTADRRRIFAICREILRQRLNFFWSCETRADRLDDELLILMRRAGCRRISLGVESGSRRILQTIRKQISPEAVLRATRMARARGIEVRFYLMVGNRGETYRTFRKSLDLIESARPTYYVFCQLHLYPGTEEFDIFQRHGCVTPDIFFSSDAACLTCFGGERAELDQIMPELESHQGVQTFCRYGSAVYRKVVSAMPDLAAGHLDLCAAYLREKRPDMAAECLRTAIRLRPPMSAQVHNLRACLAAFAGDYAAVKAHLETATGIFPPHPVVLENLARFEEWIASDSGCRCDPLVLDPDFGFETRHAPRQPEGPGPLDSAQAVF